MKSGGVQVEARPAPAIFRDRCSALGLPTWRFSAASQIIYAPEGGGVVGSWLRSGFVERAVSDAVRAWHDASDLRPIEAFEGMWLLPSVEMFRRRRTAYVVAAAMTEKVLESEQFIVACGSAELDVESTRTAMRKWQLYTVDSIDRVRLALGWMAGDLDRITQQERELETFGRQLGESYEEINLLYELGRSMNHLVHPEKFIERACDQLHGSMAFRWIAARFADDQDGVRSMAGRLFHSGDLPTDVSGLDRCARRLVLEMTEQSERILTAADAGLENGHGVVLMQPVVHGGRIVGALIAGDKQGDDRQISNADIKLLETTAGFFDVLLDNAFLYEDQRRNFMGTLEALTSAIDAKDPYTCGHSERVALLAGALSRAHGAGEEEAERIRIGGLVHDIGKIGVSESVLCKSGRLTKEEYEEIKLHPRIGYEILKDIPSLEDVLPGVLWHHERWDGRGYPDQKHGKDLPLIARVIGLVDAFDAMSSNRTYRDAMGREKVLEEIRDNAGTQFDPDLVGTFMEMDLEIYDRLLARHVRRTAA